PPGEWRALQFELSADQAEPQPRRRQDLGAAGQRGRLAFQGILLWPACRWHAAEGAPRPATGSQIGQGRKIEHGCMPAYFPATSRLFSRSSDALASLVKREPSAPLTRVSSTFLASELPMCSSTSTARKVRIDPAGKGSCSILLMSCSIR